MRKAREIEASDRAGSPKGERKVSDVLNSGTNTEVQADLEGGAVLGDATASAETKANVEVVAHSKWYLWRKDGTALVKYLLDSEVHTFAFSVAANAILTFIPLIVLLYTLAQSVFHSSAMINAVTEAVHLFMPSNQDFVAENLEKIAALSTRHGLQFFSLLMILVACTGIFLPLEVALNQAWGVVKSRNYLANQVVAFGLAILMVLLGMASIGFNAVAKGALTFVCFNQTDTSTFLGSVFVVVNSLLLAVSTGAACILFLFFIYWLLPNRKVPWRGVMRTSVVTGLIWLASKYLFFALILPHMHLHDLYANFSVSVGLIFWAYVSGLILFAGAQFSVARMGATGKES
jgi:membrane protein/epoxyqueuosine reductase